MLLGKVIAQAALGAGFNVTWLPSYGAEVRGGTAFCMVTISSEDIPSPYIERADTLIIMNQPSLIKFKQRIKSNGLLLVNASLVNSVPRKGLYLPLTQAAVRLGNIKIANMVAFGAYIAKKRIFSERIVWSAIEEIAPPEKKDLVEINKQALLTGMRMCSGLKGAESQRGRR